MEIKQNMTKNILVNASSLQFGGGRVILAQYITNLLNNNENDKTYYLFIPDTCKIKLKRDNIHYIRNSENNLYRNKDYWNSMGMKKWCKTNKVNPYELFSMQNYFPFGFNNNKTLKSRIIYLHQPTPFFDYKWNPFKKEERALWFYKNIYYFLIKKSVKESNKTIVQTEWFKNKIVNKFNIDRDKVVVEKPILNQIYPEQYNFNSRLKGKMKLFYPSSDVIYKNHEILYKAMNILVNEYNQKEIVLYLTLDNKNSMANDYIKKYKLEDNIILTGNLSYEEVMSYYKSVDYLVFPSLIETFGLPLVESQYFNLPIIASDLDLYKEVVGDYSDVVYCKYDNAREWADKIRNGFRDVSFKKLKNIV